jgi:hypothetical protein
MVVFDVSVFGQAVGSINKQFPGQVRGGTVHFLIEEIAPAANGLRQCQPGSDHIRPTGKADLMFASIKVQRNRPADHCSGNAQTTMTEVQHGERMGEIVPGCDALFHHGGRWGKDMPDTRANDTGSEHPGKHVPHKLRIYPSLFCLPRCQPGSQQHPGKNHECVKINLKRADKKTIWDHNYSCSCERICLILP